jgi:glycosyltransferase involved in cell wall biosynthesis
MKIAIFHDVLENIGGGEKLVLTLARGLGADVISANADKAVLAKMGFSDVNVISLGNTIKIPPLKQMQLSWLFYNAGLSGKYDFFIFSGNWAHYAAFKHKPNLWYCHTPPRPFYDLYDTFLGRENLFGGLVFRAWAFFHRRFDQRAAARCERIIVNSKNVQKRVARYYNRESTIVYPPIDTEKYHYRKNGDFWLSVNRLYPEKRVGLQVDVFRELPEEKLVIVGGYIGKGDHAAGYAKKIMESVPRNVTFKGNVTEEEIIQLYSDCKAVITTSLDEDFGMVPLEAMASGKPVVAVKEGGYMETVVDGKTGFFSGPDKASLAKAVKAMNDPAKYRRACISRAKEFDKSIFIEKMKKLLY